MQLVREGDDRINSLPSLSNDENLHWVRVQLYAPGYDKDGYVLNKAR